MSYALIYPMFAHVALTGLLYVMLTIARAPSIWGIGKRVDGSNPWINIEPRISHNLSNQFEWPVLFYAACLILLNQESGPASIILAWIFVLGRILHSMVQILTTNIRLRGLVFTINFSAVFALWIVIVLSTLTKHG